MCVFSTTIVLSLLLLFFGLWKKICLHKIKANLEKKVKTLKYSLFFQDFMHSLISFGIVFCGQPLGPFSIQTWPTSFSKMFKATEKRAIHFQFIGLGLSLFAEDRLMGPWCWLCCSFLSDSFQEGYLRAACFWKDHRLLCEMYVCRSASLLGWGGSVCRQSVNHSPLWKVNLGERGASTWCALIGMHVSSLSACTWCT